MKRLFFCFTWNSYRVTVKILSLLKTSFYRLTKYKVEIGQDSIIFHKSSILNFSGGGVKIGKNCLIGSSRRKYHAGMPFYTTILNDGINSEVIIGDNCRINGAYIHSEERITVGDNCVIASGVSVIDSNGHQVVSFNRTTGRDIPEAIIIGNNVWIGINSVVLKGTQIGDNSIVSAGSVVKGVFPANSIIQGNPAKIVKTISYNL